MKNDEETAKTPNLNKKRPKRKSRENVVKHLASPDQSLAFTDATNPRAKNSGNVNCPQKNTSTLAGSPLISMQAAISTSFREGTEPTVKTKCSVEAINEPIALKAVEKYLTTKYNKQGAKKNSKGTKPEKTASCEKTNLPSANLGSAETVPEQKARAFAWVTEVIHKGIENVAQEYKSIVSKASPEMCKAYMDHPNLNRYDNMFCLEQTRVKVPVEGGNDYLHANYVGLANPKNFICTQGPMDNTREKFWRMILNEGVGVVVMLCELVEKGEEKCSKYFPMESHETMGVGPVTVQCTEKSSLDHCGNVVITVRQLTVRLKDKTQCVRHYYWNAWPDHGVPTSTIPMLRLLQKTRKSKGPIVVHCSAGVGRTGTMVTVALAQECFKKPTAFEGLLWLLRKLREQRAHVVQNEMQYAFIYKCVVDWVVLKGIVAHEGNETLDKFNKDYEVFLIQAKKRKNPMKKLSREVVGSREAV